MKRLMIRGMGGELICDSLVNVEGDNFALNVTMPLFLPIVYVTLLDCEKKEDTRIKRIMACVRKMIE